MSGALRSASRRPGLLFASADGTSPHRLDGGPIRCGPAWSTDCRRVPPVAPTSRRARVPPRHRGAAGDRRRRRRRLPRRGCPGISGGFVGVDVFFVVSGFLITRLVLGELADTGTISLRRSGPAGPGGLLPASCLTVVVTVLSPSRCSRRWRCATSPSTRSASATFSANFVFAHRLGDYFGAQLGSSSPSPLLHFWSLAVEEQFYLCWPPLLVLLARRPRQYRRLVLAAIGVLAAAGFVLGVVADAGTGRRGRSSSCRPAWASCSPGPALAVVGTGLARDPGRGGGPARLGRPRRHRRVVLSARRGDAVAGRRRARCRCVGDDGRDRRRPAHARRAGAGVRARPSAAAVDRSPLLRPLPVALAGPRARRGRVGSADRRPSGSSSSPWRWPSSAVSVRLVEDPVRHSRYLVGRCRRAASPSARRCALVDRSASVGTCDRRSARSTAASRRPRPELVAAGPACRHADLDPTSTARRSIRPRPTTARRPTTAAAAATSTTAPAAPTTLATPDPPSRSARPARRVDAAHAAPGRRRVPRAVEPAPVARRGTQTVEAVRRRLRQHRDELDLQPCEYGMPGGDRTILLYGDSHAVQWFEPLEQIALQRGYRLVVLLKAGCPVADVDVPTPVLHYTCPPYRDRAITWIDEQPARPGGRRQLVHAVPGRRRGVGGGHRRDGRPPRRGRRTRVVLSATTRRASRIRRTACPRTSTTRRRAPPPAADAVRPDRISAEVVAAREHGVTFVDTTDWFCTDRRARRSSATCS